MAKNKGRVENLLKMDELTPDQRRANARKAGIASAKAKQERKAMRQMYLDILNKKYTVKLDGKRTSRSGEQLVQEVFPRMVMRGDMVTLGLLKEFRDGIDGDDKDSDGVDNELKIIITEG